jgi:hypothetical protein
MCPSDSDAIMLRRLIRCWQWQQLAASLQRSAAHAFRMQATVGQNRRIAKQPVA